MKQWLSPAKLNLFLYITGRRSEDNYHNLQTLFQLLDYGDNLTFTLRDDNHIRLITPIIGVPEENNLIIKAAKLLQSIAQSHKTRFNSDLGIDISIDKKLPMGGGLGGASSNAATVLVALNQLWQLNFSTEKLMNIGRALGADVPVFVFGHTAFAEGIGDILQKVERPEKWFLVAHPQIEVSTSKIFNHPDLYRSSPIKTLQQRLTSPFSNDIEPLIRKIYPKIDEIIQLISCYSTTRLTGTGACVFAEFNTQQEAINVKNQLPITIESFVAKGINQSPILGLNNAN
ncbi:MAG: 4-(cytidine 5'-diphospho)-2-C-methyl-D-erythritol kinase [Candidatus Schmidhempelia sp.]|nr:4-(cytidine 5'-diphospho)-2-C-methyl-D-erythritol kinase [Candidatus Schmidhempelia sp.]